MSILLKQHNTLPGAKKVLFAPINTGEVDTYDALIRCGFELYSMNYGVVFNDDKYNRVRSEIDQEFIKACKDIKPDWVYLRIHHDKFLSPKVIREAKKQSPNSVFTNWTGDVRVPPKSHFVQLGKEIDMSFIVSTGHIDLYKKYGLKIVKFVQAGFCIDRFFMRTEEVREELRKKRNHDISFCANDSDFPGGKFRREIAVKLHSNFGSKFALYGTGYKDLKMPVKDHVPYDDQNEIYNGSKIVISVNNFNDVAMYFSRRQLNAMACGTITVSKYIPGLENYFENGKDLVWFNTSDECVELVKYYLNHEDEAKEIGLNGADKVRNNHSQYCFAENMAKAAGML